jgi:hypothetical protein
VPSPRGPRQPGQFSAAAAAHSEAAMNKPQIHANERKCRGGRSISTTGGQAIVRLQFLHLSRLFCLRTTRHIGRLSAFVIRDSSFVRHSGFVIRDFLYQSSQSPSSILSGTYVSVT